MPSQPSEYRGSDRSIDPTSSEPRLSERWDNRNARARQQRPLEVALLSRIGRALYMGEGESGDLARLGHHLAYVGNPVAFSSIARTLGWTVDRLEKTKQDLARELPTLGMALFEYADELLEIGPLPVRETGEDWSSPEMLQRDSIALSGISPEGASIVRNLVDGPISSVDSTRYARELTDFLVGAGLVYESGNKIELADTVRSIYNAGQLPSRSRPIT
jgi:hypothetical protein